MTTRALPNIRRGIIENNRPKPSVMAFAISLYRTDMMFRALVDLSIVGSLTLAFALSSLATSGTRSHTARPPAAQQSTAPEKPGGAAAKLISLDIRAGGLALEAMGLPDLPDSIIAAAAPPVAAVLKQARDLIVNEDAGRAPDLLQRLDSSDPPVAYVLAMATLHKPGRGNAIEAIQRLRAATAKGFAPAFTLNGVILLRLVQFHQLGRLPDSELATLDGGGNRVAATSDDLIREAIQWWERGAAFRDAAAMRYLGMVEILGLAGRNNLAAAVAHWESAARLGDPVARTELGHLHLWGIGVEADPVKAAGYFRDAAAQKYNPAYLGVGAALMTVAAKGDHEAAREAMAALKQAIRTTADYRVAALAYTTLGVYIHDVVAPAERDPYRATAYWFAAAKLDAPTAWQLLVRALRTGVGLEQNKPLALAVLRHLSTTYANFSRAGNELEAELSAEELARAAKLTFADFDLVHVRPTLEAEGLLRPAAGPSMFYGSALPQHLPTPRATSFIDFMRNHYGSNPRRD